MNSRTLIAIAVAGTCAWPLAAAANGAFTGATFPDAAPHSVDESAPWLTAEDARARRTTLNAATYVSMPNPQTPFSPNESGQANYAQEQRERVVHVASVEQTRVAVVRENERIAGLERERLANLERERLEALERERLASAQPADAGATSSVAPSATVSAVDAVPAPAVEAVSSAPATPRETPAAPDRTPVLVDTRSIGSTGLSTAATATPETGPSETPPTAAADAPRVDANVGATSGEGATANAYVTMHQEAAGTSVR